MARDIPHPSDFWHGLVVASLLLLGSGCASAPPPVVAPPPPTSATAGATTIVAIAPSPTPAVSPPTLGQFLGLPQLARGVGGLLQRIGSRLLNGLDLTGRFPGLQPKPPVLPLTDPANMQESAPPAVQAAAEIKQEEDAAPQKIMAIRYLATLGCGGCYEKVEDALLEALSDCTEEVRYEAVKALACQPQSPCKFCNTATCCSAKVRKRLEELTTCEKEPSERIRRNARLKLACCNAVPLLIDDVPREGPPDVVAANLTPSVSSANSQLFDGIQLVSFETLAAPQLADDPVLANVNGEPIYRSQVLPLVEARLHSSGKLSDGQSMSAEREQLLASELQRVIDWMLIEQFAKSDLYPSSTAAAIPFSPEEIQAWFERRLKLETSISPQQILAHYEVHRERYRQPVRVRWECSRIWLDRCANRQQAQAAAAYLRNRAIGGQMVPPSGFAREQLTAENHDWQELHRIEPILVRTALATLQNGQVSPILEHDNQLILLRMLERTPDDYSPLPMVAEQIRSEILAERRKSAEKMFMAHLRANSRISTIFDNVSPAPDAAVTLDRGDGSPLQSTQFPTTQFPTTEFSTTEFSTSQFPTTQFPTSQFSATQVSPAIGIDP